MTDPTTDKRPSPLIEPIAQALRDAPKREGEAAYYPTLAEDAASACIETIEALPATYTVADVIAYLRGEHLDAPGILTAPIPIDDEPRDVVPIATSIPGTTPTVETIVAEACGYASVCWNPAPSGEFDSSRASLEVDRAVAAIKALPPTEPYLGLATTRQLLEELTARADVHGYAGYRTVDDGDLAGEQPAIPQYSDVHAYKLPDVAGPGQWFVSAGDYADDPDLLIHVDHAVDSEGYDQRHAVAAQIVRALAGGAA